jgi:hypothetical protein
LIELDDPAALVEAHELEEPRRVPLGALGVPVCELAPHRSHGPAQLPMTGVDHK